MLHALPVGRLAAVSPVHRLFLGTKLTSDTFLLIRTSLQQFKCLSGSQQAKTRQLAISAQQAMSQQQQRFSPKGQLSFQPLPVSLVPADI